MTNNKREQIEKALRELVKWMFFGLKGAYGAESYQGEYEREIQNLVDALMQLGQEE